MILIDLQLSGDKYAEHIYLQSLHSGAVGFISKHQSSKLLMNAIYAIHAEQTMFDRHITKQAQQARFNPNSSAEIQTEVRRSLQIKLNYV